MIEYKVNDEVVSMVCPTMIGRITKVIDNVNILVRLGSKEVLGHVNYWRKRGKGL